MGPGARGRGEEGPGRGQGCQRGDLARTVAEDNISGRPICPGVVSESGCSQKLCRSQRRKRAHLAPRAPTARMDLFSSLASLAGDEWLDAAVASQNSSVPSPDGTGEPETLPRTPRQQHFVPKTPVATVANELIVGASDEVRSRIREHLLSLRRPIRIATACSGTDLCIPVLQTLEAVLLDIFSMNNFMRCEMFEHCWSCEKEGFKQRFICEVHKVDHLYEDLTQLGCTTGYNLITGAVEHIPSFDLLICGWSCKDISMLNTKRIKDSDQLIGSHGTSGTTFHGTVSIVETHRPKAIIMENVLGVLRSASDAITGASGPDTAIEGGQETDWVDDDLITDKMRDYITKVFNQIGYVIHFRQLNACDHGFPQSRRRAYMIAVRRDAAGLGDRASQGSLAMLKEIDAAYDNLGKPMMQPIENFLLEDVEREEWQAFSEPKEVADDAPLAKRKKLQWAALHDRLFSAKGFLWPPSAEVSQGTRNSGTPNV